MSGGRFERCLRFTLREEGGYSDQAGDHGGVTNFGITQATLDAARLKGFTRARWVKDLRQEDVDSLFWSGYWIPSRAMEMPAPLDLCLFDAYVNHRPEVAVKLVQASVGAEQDGIVGPKTVALAQGSNLLTAVERYSYEREQLYRRIVKGEESQGRFLKGWLNRVAHVKAAALAEVA